MTNHLPGSFRGVVGRALIELAAPTGPADLGLIKNVEAAGKLEELSARVVEHRLDAPFVGALLELGLPVADGHRNRVDAERVARMRATAALARIAPVLDAQAIRWAAVKGPMVAARMKRPEHRGYNDLDLLIAAGQLGGAVDALLAEGAEELNRNWAGYLRYRVGEVPMRFGGVAIDLHWSLIGLGRWRDTMRLDTTAMLSRRVSVRLGDSTVSGLDDVDALLHLCVHTALGGAGRLDQLRDIAVMVGDSDLFGWDEFSRRSRDALVGSLVAHALDRSAIVLGTPVPKDVLERLGGRSLHIRRWVDTVTASDDQAGFRGLPVIAARDTVASRWRARGVLAGARIRSIARPNHSWDFADPQSVLYQDTSAGGAADRQAFIELAR